MKLLIASDVHGDFESAEMVINKFKEEDFDRILFLGDILYHGPRNDLPSTYAPKKVIALLNEHKDKILAVRGNCDTEVDQMVLEFPILADYALLSLDGLTIFATHGHHHNTQTPPPLSFGDILLHGHTHVLTCEEFGNKNTYLNPGSVALPKEGNPRTYMAYEDRCFRIKTFDGKVILEKRFDK
ncbi:MAG: phosphodiesterase [Clostridia bacterium]|nr:phosphodiesterase [Clostridia bacterium]